MSDAKREVRYVLKQEDVDYIVQVAASKGISAYRDEQRKQGQRYAREHDKGKMTKKLLSSYRRLKKKIKEEKEFTDDEKIEFRWKFIEDLMGSPDRSEVMAEKEAKSREKQRREDLYNIFRIEQAVSLYEDECNKRGEYEVRRCRELKAMYIDDGFQTAEDIAKCENVSTRTVYDDIDKACKIVAVYLFGADIG